MPDTVGFSGDLAKPDRYVRSGLGRLLVLETSWTGGQTCFPGYAGGLYFHVNLCGLPTPGRSREGSLAEHMDDVSTFLQGTPFSNRKWRGGLHVEWVGYWIDYTRFHIGISEKRCNWILSSIEGIKANGWLVDVRRFHELRGRLGLDMDQTLSFSGIRLAVRGATWGCTFTAKLGSLYSAIHQGQAQKSIEDIPGRAV